MVLGKKPLTQERIEKPWFLHGMNVIQVCQLFSPWKLLTGSAIDVWYVTFMLPYLRMAISLIQLVSLLPLTL